MDLDLDSVLSYGTEQAEEMADATRSAGGLYVKTNYLKLADKESITVRFLEDRWPTVLQHSFVSTKDPYPGASESVVKNWPKKMGAVCRQTKGFEQFFPEGCVICSMTGNPDRRDGRYAPTPRLWVRAVEREEVVADDELAKQYEVPVGTVLGLRDAEDEVDEIGADGKATGEKVMRKRVIVINMGMKNFFSGLQGYLDVHKTVLDRDYRITRIGEGTKTDYRIIALDPLRRDDGTIVSYADPEIVDGQPTGLSRAETILLTAPKLSELIQGQLDDDHYRKFFDRSQDYTPPKRSDDDKPSGGGASSGGSRPKTSSSVTPPPADTAKQSATVDRLAAIRNKVRSGVPAPEQPQSAPDVEEPGQAEPVAAGAGGSAKAMRDLG